MSALSPACDFKSQFFANSMKQSDQGPYCLPVCKNKFEKFARISADDINTQLSDAWFLGIDLNFILIASNTT